jgi:large subunit ribosomal protein L1
MSSYGTVLPTVARGILSSCRPALREKSIAPAFSTFQQVRGAKSNPQARGKGKKDSKSDRKGPREFRQKNLKDMEQHALCDAMRYAIPWVSIVGIEYGTFFDIASSPQVSPGR